MNNEIILPEPEGEVLAALRLDKALQEFMGDQEFKRIGEKYHQFNGLTLIRIAMDFDLTIQTISKKQ